MKKLMLACLTLVCSSVFAMDFLEETANILESDYQMICTATSQNTRHCHDKASKLIGVRVELSNDGRADTLEFRDINSSKSALLNSNRAKDSRFWGKKIVVHLINKIEESYGADCAELHENFIGKDKEYVFKPWWQEVVRSECLDSKGQGLKIKANIGQDGNFLKSIKFF